MIAKRRPCKITPYPSRRNPGRVFVSSRHERKSDEELAATLMTLIGGDVKFLPELNIPSAKNPDCEWQGRIWEIKTLYKAELSTIRNALHNASKQSQNIVINAYSVNRGVARIVANVQYCLLNDRTTFAVKQVLILGKKEYSILKRSMLK